MKEECILCRKISEVRKPNAKKGEFYVECDICKNYSYDHFFKSSYISMTEDERAMISAYTRECYELGIEPPKLGDPDYLREKIEEYKNKANDEKLDNLILYLKKNSKHFGDSIPWDERKDYPITYSPNHQESEEIVREAFKKGLREKGARGVGLKLTWEGWKRGEHLEKRIKMKIEEQRQQFLQKLDELTESNENDSRDMWEIGRTLGFPNNLTNRIGQYLEGECLIVFRTDQGEISITHEGIKEIEKALSEKDKIEPKKKAKEEIKVDPKKVFVVHGRNEKARIAMFSFLRSIDLKPLEWEEAVRLTGEASPFPQQVLDAAFMIAQAIIILITGDDIGKLRDEYINAKDKEYERNLTIQARQNVIFEAGLAFGRNPKRTILVELEKEDTRPFSDIYGRLTVRLSNDAKLKKKLIDRLTTAGCHTNIDARNDWMSTGDFDSAVHEYKPGKKGIIERESKNTELFEKVISESENGYFWLIDAIANEEENAIEGLFLDRYKAKFKKRIADFKGMVSFFEVNGIIQRIWRHTYTELYLNPKGYSLLKYWNKKLKDRK